MVPGFRGRAQREWEVGQCEGSEMIRPVSPYTLEFAGKEINVQPNKDTFTYFHWESLKIMQSIKLKTKYLTGQPPFQNPCPLHTRLW
jgi:hypothetical protein